MGLPPAGHRRRRTAPPHRRAPDVRPSPRTSDVPGPPPWLWLCLILFAIQVPGPIGRAVGAGRELREIDGTQHGLLTTTLLGLVQLLPLLFLLAAVLALLAPRARCRHVERRYGLLPPDHRLVAPPARRRPGVGETPVPHFYEQMAAVLAQHAPGVELRVSTRSRPSARVYPAGVRTARIGVFAPLVHLWHTDPEAARAVLLHELGHVRQGDQHVAGLGSPLVALVRAWPYVLAGLVVVPVVLLFATGDATARPVLAQVVLVLLSVPKVLLLVVAALWSAELAADRRALASCGPDSLVRALRSLGAADHGGLARLHHPPVRLRTRCALRSGEAGTHLLLTLLWPFALLVQLLLTTLGAATAFVLLGARPERVPGHVLALAHSSLTADPAWWATLAAVLLWPLVAGARSGGGRPRLLPSRPHAVAALLPACLLTVGLLPLAPGTADDLYARDRNPAPRVTASARPGAEGARPESCPSASAPPAPAVPTGLPTFGPPPAPAGTAPPAPGAYRTAAVESAEGLSGRAAWARDFGDRLRGARWTLHADGRLTSDAADVPVLRTTAAEGPTRLLGGRRTTRTDVSATTTWTEARLGADGNGAVRLELVRAVTQVLRAVVACRESTAVSRTVMRVTLRLRAE
ncbi:M48 family metalloprotease [Streptomyces fructofermentans]|uniref:M48 family metalloprotease n=1 Tax=Streptomyces fructofermentans TaxID=152141 RepID=UPI00378FD341